MWQDDRKWRPGAGVGRSRHPCHPPPSLFRDPSRSGLTESALAALGLPRHARVQDVHSPVPRPPPPLQDEAHSHVREALGPRALSSSGSRQFSQAQAQGVRRRARGEATGSSAPDWEAADSALGGVGGIRGASETGSGFGWLRSRTARNSQLRELGGSGGQENGGSLRKDGGTLASSHTKRRLNSLNVDLALDTVPQSSESFCRRETPSPFVTQARTAGW
ncbi:uncharacterized protein LOC123632729 isoform X2 [Lemur catta]|uniref:uncharacterized protein LOC123632729 isoform X2 n=1 Tax=Lemur catta TaxID=9447 RepID=UPI001E26B1C0|nr:uncharacterized protein LOC123632729 isoform X2 [Lemur catta]